MNLNVWDVAETVARLVAAKQPLDPRSTGYPDVVLSDLLDRQLGRATRHRSARKMVS